MNRVNRIEEDRGGRLPLSGTGTFHCQELVQKVNLSKDVGEGVRLTRGRLFGEREFQAEYKGPKVGECLDCLRNNKEGIVVLGPMIGLGFHQQFHGC